MVDKGDQESEKRLIERSRGGDKAAFRELVERYQSRVFSLAFGVLKSKEDAEDVTQETFVKAYLSLANFEGKSSFYTWIYRIGFNMSVDFKRKVKRRGGVSVELTDIAEQNHDVVDSGLSAGSVFDAGSISDPATPHSELVKKEQREQIKAAMESLSDDHRAVVTLREIDGLSYEEIAETLDVSKGTVMSRLHYARKRLQEALRDVAPEGAAPGVDEESAIQTRMPVGAVSK